MSLNIYKQDFFLLWEEYNLNYFGYGRHGKECTISGHYTFCYNTESKLFTFWKHGDYKNLTSIVELAPDFRKANEADYKCMHDYLHVVLEHARGYTPGNHEVGENTIFEYERGYFEITDRNIDIAKEYFRKEISYPYLSKLISPQIRYGDTVLMDGKKVALTGYCIYDISYLNRDEKVKLIGR